MGPCFTPARRSRRRCRGMIVFTRWWAFSPTSSKSPPIAKRNSVHVSSFSGPLSRGLEFVKACMNSFPMTQSSKTCTFFPQRLFSSAFIGTLSRVIPVKISSSLHLAHQYREEFVFAVNRGRTELESLLKISAAANKIGLNPFYSWLILGATLLPNEA